MGGDSYMLDPQLSQSSKSPNSKSISLSLSKKRKFSVSAAAAVESSRDASPDSGIHSDFGSGGGETTIQSALTSPRLSTPSSKRRVIFDEDEEEENDSIFVDDPNFWQQLDRVEEEYQAKESAADPVEMSDAIETYDSDGSAAAAAAASSSSLALPEVNRTDKGEEGPREKVDETTTQFEGLMVSTPVPTKRKPIGEDVFTESCVKTWQTSRIKAWEGRYTNPEGYYFRFVVPREGQQNGGWSQHEHKLFMAQYNEWVSHGWKIGTSWGLFSKGIPHRVGYQCMNYYRKLVGDNKIKDESYAIVDGKLKQVHKERAPTGEVPTTELGTEWASDDVKQVEKDVDRWLKQYHSRSGLTTTVAARKSSAATSAASRVAKTTTPKKNNIGEMVKKMPPPRPRMFDDSDDDAFMEGAEPEHANLHVRAHDWEKEWQERLERYKTFMQPFLDPTARHDYWVAKQEWRRGLTTTEMLLSKKPVTVKTPLPEENATKTVVRQASLSRFFTGVKKLKVDTPDEFISNVRIPNELFSGVHQIMPIALKPAVDEEKNYYCEVDDMMECHTVLDALLGPVTNDEVRTVSPLEGILVDPPWEFYVKDGRNDGKCTWNAKDMMKLMKKVLQQMTAGLVFVWTHKLVQADIVRLMDELDCRYVENLVWFKKNINNVSVDQPSPYISSSKEILLMFKKGEGFELRHQRTADVIIDFEQPTSQWIDSEFTEPKPPAVYDMIETLLPRAGYNEDLKRGRLLELWAKCASPKREGWIAFHQRKNNSSSAAVKSKRELCT